MINRIEKLKNYLNDCCFNISIYDCEGMTITELLCNFANKINEIVEVTNNYTEMIIELKKWMLGEGFPEEIKKQFLDLIETDYFKNLINNELFYEINHGIELVNERVDLNKSNIELLRKSMDNLDKKIELVKSNIPYVDVLNPLNDLKPCVGNGEFDDTLNFQKIHDYLESIGGGIIYIPRCVIRITDTFYWNMRKVLIKCDGKIYADINGYNKYAIQSRSDASDDYDLVYDNDLMKNEGLEVYGKVEKNANNDNVSHGTCNGMLFSDIDKIGVSRVSFDRLKLKYFRTGLTLGENSYANHFERLSISKCDLNLETKVMKNAGEKWSFENCLFYNSKDCFKFDNDNSTVYFYNCSIDYNYNNIIHHHRGKVFFDLCHIEQLEEHYRDKTPIILEQNDGVSLTFSNSFIMFNYNPQIGYVKKFLFENKYKVNPFSGITFDNCFLQGCKTKTGFLAEDGGLNIFKNSSTYQWDDLPCYINHFSNHVIDGQVLNADLNYHPDFIITDSPERIEKGIKYQAWGEGDGGHALMCKKIGEPQNFAEVSFIVPIDKACHLVSAKLDYKSNVDDTLDIYFGTCTMIGDKIGYRNYMFRNGLLPTSGEARTFNVNNGHQINVNDNKATHFFLSVNLFNTKQNTEIYLKNIFIDQI